MTNTPVALIHDRSDDEVIRVLPSADVKATANAILFCFGSQQEVIVRAIGASAVNQAVKSVAIARSMVALRGLDMVCRPGFLDVPDAGHRKDHVSAIVLRLRVS
jgi:stage V sporulation protein S